MCADRSCRSRKSVEPGKDHQCSDVYSITHGCFFVPPLCTCVVSLLAHDRAGSQPFCSLNLWLAPKRTDSDTLTVTLFTLRVSGLGEKREDGKASDTWIDFAWSHLRPGIGCSTMKLDLRPRRPSEASSDRWRTAHACCLRVLHVVANKPVCHRSVDHQDAVSKTSVASEQRLVSFHSLILAVSCNNQKRNILQHDDRSCEGGCQVEKGRGIDPFEKSFEGPPGYLSSVWFSSRTEPCGKTCTLGSGICRRYLISVLFPLLKRLCWLFSRFLPVCFWDWCSQVKGREAR